MKLMRYCSYWENNVLLLTNNAVLIISALLVRSFMNFVHVEADIHFLKYKAKVGQTLLQTNSKLLEKWAFLYFLRPLSLSPLLSFLPFILHREVSYGCDRGQLVWNPAPLQPSKAKAPHAVSTYTSLFHRWVRESTVWFKCITADYFFSPVQQQPFICDLMQHCSLGSLKHLSSFSLPLLAQPPQPGSSQLRTTAAWDEGNTFRVGGVFIKHYAGGRDMTSVNCWRSKYMYFCQSWRERSANIELKYLLSSM